MKILITGGAGFIGSHLVDALVQAGETIRVVDCLQPQVHRGKKPAYLNPRAEYRFQDLLEEGALERALEGQEAVVHLAARVGVGQSMYEVEPYVRDNVLGTARLLQAIARDVRNRIRRLVVASSMSIYGEGLYRCEQHGEISPPPRQADQLERRQWELPCPRCGETLLPLATPEGKTLQPTSVYAVTKRDQEELCLTVGQAYRIPTTALRFFNVYGPRQSLSNPYTGACAIFSARLKAGKPPVLYEDGQQTRDFAHVSDVVQAIRLALERPGMAGGAFNVGTGQAVSIQEVAQTLGLAYESKAAPVIAGRFRAGDIRHCVADIRKIQAQGFRPRVPLKEGLLDLVQWGAGAEAQDLFDQAERELAERKLLGEPS